MEIQEKINKLIEDYNKQRRMMYDNEAERIEDLNINFDFLFFLQDNADNEVVDFIFEKKNYFRFSFEPLSKFQKHR